MDKTEEYGGWVDQLVDSVLGTGHNLSDTEVHTCGRVLYNIRTTLYFYDLAKQHDNWYYLHVPDGTLIRITRDIIFLMAFLSEKAGGKGSKVLSKDAFAILREVELPENIRKILDHRYESLSQRREVKHGNTKRSKTPFA